MSKPRYPFVPHRVVPGLNDLHDHLFSDVTLEWAHGRCAWFALAAARRWDLPLIGFRDERGHLVHVACQARDGLLDAYGLGTAERVIADFHRLGCRAALIPAEVTAQRVRSEFYLEGPDHDEEIAAALSVCTRLIADLKIPPSSLSRAHLAKPSDATSPSREVEAGEAAGSTRSASFSLGR